MKSVLRSVLGKLSSLKTTKNKHPIPHIDGAENLLIDSSVLCCPICYNVYSSVPSILTCGHTFCGACVQAVARTSANCPTTQEVCFRCPMCREEVFFSRVVKNYLVEDLLKSVEELCPDMSMDCHKVANIRITKERYVQRCSELEQMNNRLNHKLDEKNKNEMKNYACIAVLFIAYLLLTGLLG